MEQVLEVLDDVNDKRRRVYLALKESEQTYLTSKEIDIVKRLTSGRRAKEIAWEMGSSLHTVNTHLANIKDKLGCENIFQLGFTLGRHLPELC